MRHLGKLWLQHLTPLCCQTPLFVVTPHASSGAELISSTQALPRHEQLWQRWSGALAMALRLKSS